MIPPCIEILHFTPKFSLKFFENYLMPYAYVQTRLNVSLKEFCSNSQLKGETCIHVFYYFAEKTVVIVQSIKLVEQEKAAT